MAQSPQQQERAEQWNRVVARAWSDEAFKKRLLGDPRAALAEAGMPIPANVNVHVHAATATDVHLMLPPPPRKREGGELSEADLDQVAGGFFSFTPFFCW